MLGDMKLWPFILLGVFLVVAWMGLNVARTYTLSHADDPAFYNAHAKALQEDLGFVHGSPYIRVKWRLLSQEVMTFEQVRPEGPLARAGIREGDIVADKSLWYVGFYRMLEAARGKEVVISVVAGGDGPPLTKRPVRKVSVFIPARPNHSLELRGGHAPAGANAGGTGCRIARHELCSSDMRPT
jgi:hypothetical protein